MTPSGAGAVEVFVFKNGRFLGSRCFAQTPIIIGAARDAGLKLVDATVAERHAVVRVDGQNVIINDNGSQSGVFVNGEQISVRRVSSFDEIAVGPFRLKVTLLGQEDEDAGFGAEGAGHGPRGAPEEDIDQATVVRRVDQAAPPGTGQGPAHGQDPPGSPSPYIEQATLPHYARTARDDAMSRKAGAGAPAPGAPRIGAPRPSRYFGREASPRGPEQGPPHGGQDPYHDVAATRAESPLSRRGSPVADRQDARAASPRGAPPAHASAAAGRRPEFQLPSQELEEEQLSPAPRDLDDEDEASALASESDLADLRDYGEESSSMPFGDGGAGAEEPEPPDPDGGRDDDDDDEDEDEDEEDEEDFVEPFSLLENVVRERFKQPIATESFRMVEVIYYEGNEVRDILRADPGERIRISPDGFHLATMEKDGRASLYFRQEFKGTLVSRGKARPLKNFCADKFKADRKGKLFAVSLNEGDYAQIVRGTSGYLIRFVKPPTQPKLPRTFGSTIVGIFGGAAGVQCFFGSMAFHFVLFVLMALVGGIGQDTSLALVSDADTFAKVSMKDLELEKPKVEEPKKEEPKAEKPKDEPKPKTPPKEAPPVKHVVKRQRVVVDPEQRKAMKAAAAEVAQKQVQQKQVSNVLSALQNIRPGAGPGRADLKSAITNIYAVRVRGGSSGGYQISGQIGKIPGGGIRLAGGIGGGGGSDTRVGSQLLAGGRVGSIAAAAGTGNRVRGRVRSAPQRAIQATGGTLDRGAIQQVVNSHMAEIQRCYEVQLLKSPGLAGKIVFDWVISPSGSVTTARQVSSSVSSPEVASCVLSLIRGWRFPQPVGGAVQVRYPFVFRVQGF